MSGFAHIRDVVDPVRSEDETPGTAPRDRSL